MTPEPIPQQDSLIDLQLMLQKLRQYWYLFFLSVPLALLVAFAVTRYTTPLYDVSTTVLIKQPTDPSNASINLLYGQELFTNEKNLNNEAIMLKSNDLVKETIQHLDFGISYFAEGNIKFSEIYGESPVRVLLDSSSTNIPYGTLIKFERADTNTFRLSANGASLQPEQADKTYAFGRLIDINGFRFVVQLLNLNQFTSQDLFFQINDTGSLVNRYRSSLAISTIPETSILEISAVGDNTRKAIAFLNQHVQTYILQSLEEKNGTALNTINFIDEQLQQISDSLSLVEGRLENFKRANTGLTMSEEGTQANSEVQDLEREKAALLLNAKYFDYLKNYIAAGDITKSVIAPSSFGVTDPVLNQLIQQLVEVQLQLTSLSAQQTQNPLVVTEIETSKTRIRNLLAGIAENLDNLKRVNQISISDINARIGRMLGALHQLPAAERQLINLNRMHELSEGLYVFLMQKRAEAGITTAATTPDAKLVNAAAVKAMITPKPKQNYLIALFLGLLLPAGFIFLKDLLNNKVTSTEDIARLTTLPLLGMVGHNKKEQTGLMDQSPKSALAEAFRTVRSNLRFMTSVTPGQGKIFVVTSSISGEGKTFSAKNLAYIFSISGERTLLVNADMRKPNNNTDFGVSSGLGLSNYLAGYTSLDEVVHHTLQENLHILPSGDIPPNPSELLLSKRMDDLVRELKSRYDYILLDTPPVGLLSDGLELMQLADANIFMVRQGYTFKSFLNNIQQQYETGKVRNTAILFNDVDFTKLNYRYGYGYGYGYGYYAEDIQPRPWWRFF